MNEPASSNLTNELFLGDVPGPSYLAHEDCEPTGAVYEVGAGWLARVRWQRAHGAVCESDLQGMSPEWVRDHISEAEV